MQSNENHTKPRRTVSKPQRTTVQQDRRDKAKTWERIDKRTAWN